MKRMIAVLLILALLISAFPVTCFADNGPYVDVTVEDAPIRKDNNGKAKVLYRCQKNMTLKTLKTTYNRYLNKWYKVEVGDEVGYIYSGNVKQHVHEYQTINVNDVDFKICSCGNISADTDDSSKEKWAESSMETMAMALALPVADGPLPLGDLAAVGLVALGIYTVAGKTAPAADTLVGIITELDFDNYLANRANNSCPAHTYRRVLRGPGYLQYLDHYCLDAVEAYLYVRVLLGDVYTENEDDALMLASMHNKAYMERDKARPDKDVSTYFFHYHLGDRPAKPAKRGQKVHGHIFFGLNDRGEGPIE